MKRLACALIALLCASAVQACGTVFEIETHASSTTRYALSLPTKSPTAVLVLLAGGSGFVDLDAQGCARKLKGNWLVRSLALFHAQGFTTVLVDAPSDHQGEDGLGSFRGDAQHARDLGRLIARVRAQVDAPVWLLGTSRGTISAAHAAASLRDREAPDGVILTSPVTVGAPQGRKAFTVQTVFDAALERVKQPVLIVAHAQDSCARTPAARIKDIAARLASTRKQTVIVSGGPGGAGQSSLEACEGRSPHGFIEQEAEVAAGIARFVRGEPY